MGFFVSGRFRAPPETGSEMGQKGSFPACFSSIRRKRGNGVALSFLADLVFRFRRFRRQSGRKRRKRRI